MFLVLRIFFCVQVLTAEVPAPADNVSSTLATVILSSETTQISNSTMPTAIAINVTSSVPTASTCNSNDSTCNTIIENGITTELPRVTTTEAPQNQKTEAATMGESNINLETYKAFDSSMCTCDLQRNFCDINCCCDGDCTFEDKQVFQNCKYEANFYRDTSYCQYTDYIYLNNTPYSWEVNQNGLFCIAKSNVPAQYSVQKQNPLTTLEDAGLQKRDKYSWSDPGVLPDIELNSNESLMYGSNVWIMKSNVTQPLKLPNGFITNACLIREDVTFLRGFKRKCVQTELSENNPDLNVENYFVNVTVVRAPKFLYNINYKGGCPKNICLPIEAKVCDEDHDNCKILLNNSTSKLRASCNATVCLNVAQTIKYNFYHNGTWGFTRIELYSVLANISLPADNFLQHFEVGYFWSNYSTNYTLLLSGNPGYLVGKPLLIASLIPVLNVTNSTTNNHTNVIGFKLGTVPHDIPENFLVFPANKKGACFLNNRTYVPSEFGYNMILKCEHEKSYHIKDENVTATDLCVEMQKEIFNYWPLSRTNLSIVNKVIGRFGNANRSVLGDWIEVLSNKSPALVLNEISGTFTRQNKSITCRNIVTTLKMDIFHSRIDIKSLLNQEKVLGVVFNFVGRNNFTFNIDERRNFNFKSFVREEIMFYDITSERVKEYVDPPTFTITLPYDFFYPFIKVDNSAYRNNSQFSIVFVLLVYVGLNSLTTACY